MITRRQAMKLAAAGVAAAALSAPVWPPAFNEGWPFYGGRAWFEARFSFTTLNRIVVWRYDDGEVRHLMGFITPRFTMIDDPLWREKEKALLLGMRGFIEEHMAAGTLFRVTDEDEAFLRHWPIQAPEIFS